MTLKPFMGFNNCNNLYKIKNGENLSEFFPIKTNNYKDENLFDIKLNDHTIHSISDDESLHNIFDIKKNFNKNLSKKYYKDSFYEIEKVAQLEKLMNVKNLIFRIKKRRKKNFNYLERKRCKGSKKKLLKNLTLINKDNENFPFTKSNGIINYNLPKFHTKQTGKNKKVKRRKYKMHNITKKIKSRFLKELKNIINKNLIISDSKKFIDYLPQSFISNMSKLINLKYLNSTYRELLTTNFIEINKNNNVVINTNQKRFLKNEEVLKYLEQNPEISELSGFDLIKDMKCKDLFKRYLKSKEFENSILRLKDEGENLEYINKYIIIAKDYIEYYNNFQQE